MLQAFNLLGFQPAKDLVPYTDIIKRQTVRVWDFDGNVPTNPRTIQLPGAQGVIDVKVRWWGWVRRTCVDAAVMHGPAMLWRH